MAGERRRETKPVEGEKNWLSWQGQGPIRFVEDHFGSSTDDWLRGKGGRPNTPRGTEEVGMT